MRRDVVNLTPDLIDSRTFRVFVGTMYSEENELHSSIASVKKQIGVEINHFFVKGLPEREAHQTLYRRWNEIKHDYGVFVKIDADTVIRDNEALRTICQYLACSVSVGSNALQCPLYDWLSDKKIIGVSVYHRSVVINDPTDDISCDVCMENISTAHPDGLPEIINPIGIHCGNPTNRQAFRYGLHRGIKGYDWQRQQIEDAYNRLGDDRRLFAVAGFRASDSFLKHRRANYTDKEFNDAFFEVCQNMS